jgi:hypothetical protein
VPRNSRKIRPNRRAHLQAPGYPAVVALVIKLFGAGSRGEFALLWLTKIAVAVQLALLPFLARYLGLGPITGLIAAAGWLIARVRSLSDFAGLLIVILAFPMYKALHIRLSSSELVCTGLFWGLLLLTSPVPLVVLGAWLVALLLTSPQPKWTIAVLGVLPLLVITPWLVRNYCVFHSQSSCVTILEWSWMFPMTPVQSIRCC